MVHRIIQRLNCYQRLPHPPHHHSHLHLHYHPHCLPAYPQLQHPLSLSLSKEWIISSN